MTAEVGVFFLIAALLLAALQAAYLWPNRNSRETLAGCMPVAAWLQALCVACAFAVLILLRLESDFSVMNVATHSNLTLPTLYKITGAWGNHEGSMVLWVMVLSAFGLGLCLSSSMPPPIKSLAVAVQAALAAGALLFVLITSNPFSRQFPPPADGAMLNPILQDVALAMHPPLLYIGYVGFSLVFSLTVAALLAGQAGREFARATRPWILISWTALTLGIGLGSWWAYRELGWGGFWFWDPVENASLLPWLAGTALLHSNIVLEKRGQLASWVLLLSILTFGLSMLGTFLVRSGALTSVHSFASDPARGLFILVYMAATLGGALLLYGLRAPRIATAEPMLPVSREGMIVFNNLFLLCACAIVLLGTIYPLMAEWISGDRITVGAPYFNATFIPLMALPLLLAGLAPLMPWKQASFRKALSKAFPAILAAAAAMLIILALARASLAYALLGMGISAWLLASSLQWLTGVWRILPRAYALSVFFAHGGAAILVLGITGMGLWQQEINHMMASGDGMDIAGYRITYAGEETVRTENYQARRGELVIALPGGQEDRRLFPEYRRYDIRGTVTHEAAVYSDGMNDLYAVIGEASGDGKRTAMRLYYNPMIGCVWLGFLCMALAGALALAHARQRNRVV